MGIKVILFDLDGTLLPMDYEIFTKSYFSALAKKLAPYGYDAKELVDAIWKGTAAMVKNDGKENNEKVFWQAFSAIFGEKVHDDIRLFDEFYRTDFQNIEKVCGHNGKAKDVISLIKKRGFRIALATNPIFPSVATESRVRWAGLDIKDFELYTTYENIGYCKPNPEYYLEIAKRLGVAPQECLMVGNDVAEDMIASTVGMRVFLLTDCLINKQNEDISAYPNGDFDKLCEFIVSLSGE